MLFALVNIPVAIVNAAIAGLLVYGIFKTPTPEKAHDLYKYSIAFPYIAGAVAGGSVSNRTGVRYLPVKKETMSKVIVLGAGLSGLASAALLARAGHEVTVLERHDWLGGKSRRVTVAGQIMDTGPALVTFTGVWDKLLESYDQLGEKQSKTAREIADLEFVKLNELGRYYYKDEVTDLPVKPDHKWFEPWQRFEKEHAPLTEPITRATN